MNVEAEIAPRKRKRRTRFPPEVKTVLEEVYERTKHPDRQQVTDLAQQLSYRYETIKMWFDNRRYNEVNRPSGRKLQQLAKEQLLLPKDRQVTCMGVPVLHQPTVWSGVDWPQVTGQLPADTREPTEKTGRTQNLEAVARGRGTQTACTNSQATRSAPPLTLVRPIMEPFLNENEGNSVLDVEDGTRGDYKKTHEVGQAFESFLEMVRGRKEQYKLSDYEDFKREVQRLFHSLQFICEMRFSQGDRRTVR